jgi:hypothetical protein
VVLPNSKLTPLPDSEQWARLRSSQKQAVRDSAAVSRLPAVSGLRDSPRALLVKKSTP